MERNKPIVENDNDGDSSEAECDESDSDNEQVSTLDPVTNQTMIDPLKNTICRHSYERSPSAHLMQIEKVMSCLSSRMLLFILSIVVFR